MNKFELFTILHEFLNDYRKENEVTESYNYYLYDSNPYVWKDCVSADPATYAEYEKWIGKKNITLENSYDIAKEYVYFLNDDYYNLEEIRKAFDSISRDRWIDACKDYLSKPHKGDNL